jgi:MFS superfamily sulfate permease-like transporter
MVSLVSGIIIGLFIAYFLFCVRRHFYRNRKPKRNPEQQTTEVDTTYQELDLTKMNTEDNYQSLRVNAAASNNAVIPVNDDESAYTELNRGARDDENNYQSLT